MTLKLLIAPTVEPVSLAEAKLDARRDDSLLDSTLEALIRAVREQCEHEIGRPLIEQTWEQVLDDWPCDGDAVALLPGSTDIVSVKYTDTSGAVQTLAPAAYSLEADSTPSRLWPVSGTWPTATPGPGAVRVQFKAGFGPAAADVPASIRTWIRANVQSWAACGGALTDKPMTPNPHLSALLDRWRTYA